jgi:methionine biosynthesis protein MetW
MDLRDFYDTYWQSKDDSVDYDRLELILRWIDAGAMVLQVDGGPGMLAEKIQARSVRVVMTETSKVAATRAHAKGLLVVRADPDTDPLPFGEGRFDIVVSDSAIEHRFSPERSVEESIRVLRPGGKYILMVPNLGHWKYRLWLLLGRFPWVQNSPTDRSHIRFYTLYEARRMLAKRGLKIIGQDGSACLWVKGLIPLVLRLPLVDCLYSRLARFFPSLLARDVLLVARKPDKFSVVANP